MIIITEKSTIEVEVGNCLKHISSSIKIVGHELNV